MPTVVIHDGSQVHTINAPEGETLLRIALDNHIPVEHACGGNGFCTTCLCTVKEGSLSEITDREEGMGIEHPYRLSCQARISGDVTVELTAL